MQQSRQVGRPRSLTFDRVVDAAMRIAERDGVEAVSLRAVSRELGVSSMTLYTYVGSREELLAALTDRTWVQVELPAARGKPEEVIVRACLAAFETFQLYPSLVAQVGRNPVVGTAAWSFFELVVHQLERLGFAPVDAFRMLGTLYQVTFATALMAANSAAADVTRPLHQSMEQLRDLPDGSFPRLTALFAEAEAQGALSEDWPDSLRRTIRFLIEGPARAS